MDVVVYRETRLCSIILGHMCRWKILKLSDLMFSQSEGTGWRNMWMMWYIKKICFAQ